MNKSGDYTHILASNVPNLEWLKIDEDEYRKLEKLPEKNLDILQDLIEAWSHDNTPNPLVHNYADRAEPFRVDSFNTKELEGSVSKILKEKIMSGWDPIQLASWARENVQTEHIASLMPLFKKIALERNLLGKVYIDATHWENCDNGEGKKIAQRATLAKFVLGKKEKCSGCISNMDGRCGVFKKEIVFDIVPYKNNLVTEYQEKLKVPNKAITASTPKEKLQEIFSYVHEELQDENSNSLKGVETVGNQDLRNRSAMGLYTPPLTEFENPNETALYRDLSQKMMVSKGSLTDIVKNRVACSDSKALETLRKEENLLGRVYVRPDQFKTCHIASDFFRKHNVRTPYILKIANKCDRCTFHKMGSCSLMGTKVVSEIPYTKDILTNEIDSLVSTGKISKKIAQEFILRAEHESIKEILSEALGTKVAKDVTEYQVKYKTQSLMTPKEASESIYKEETITVPLKHQAVVHDAYKATYKGVTGERLKNHLVSRYTKNNVIEASEYLKPVVKLAGLLGNVVLDMRGFKSAQEAKDLLSQHNMHPLYILKEGCGTGLLGDLPDYTKSFPQLTKVSYDDLLNTDIDLNSIISKLEKYENITSEKAANLKSRIASENVWDLIQEAYLSPKPLKATAYREEVPQKIVSKEIVETEFKKIEEQKSQDFKNGLKSLISSYADSERISSDTAKKLIRKLSSVDYSKQEVVEILSKEEILYNTSKIEEKNKLAKRYENYVSDKYKLSEKIVEPKISECKKLSSTQKLSFQTSLIQSINKGITGGNLKKWIRNSYELEMIKSQASFIKEAISLKGLGEVYIDPQPYTTCTVGSQELKKVTARYVKSIEKCAKCIYNKESKCLIYKKAFIDLDRISEYVKDPIVSMIETEQEDINPVLQYGLGETEMDIRYNLASKNQDLNIQFEDSFEV